MDNNIQLHNDNKMLLRALSVVSAGFAFFAIAFYNKVDKAVDEQAKSNSIMAVAVSQIAVLNDKVDKVQIKVDDNKSIIDGLSTGFATLKVRVGHLEESK